MKLIIGIFISLFITNSFVFAQEKNLASGTILFHAIEKNDVQATSTKFESMLNLEAKTITFEIPIQNFKFESELMQKHFNAIEHINSELFPTATFKGVLIANSVISTEGRHIAKAKGELTIKGITHSIEINGLLVNKSGATTLNASFLIDATTFGLTASKIKGFADKIEVSVNATY